MLVQSCEYNGWCLNKFREIIKKDYGIDNLAIEDFRRFDLIHPWNHKKRVDIFCPKCATFKFNHKPKNKKSVEKVLKHLASSIHQLEDQCHPTKDFCISFIWHFSFLVQVGFLEEVKQILNSKCGRGST